MHTFATTVLKSLTELKQWCGSVCDVDYLFENVAFSIGFLKKCYLYYVQG